jgi:hypothetical protein
MGRSRRGKGAYLVVSTLIDRAELDTIIRFYVPASEISKKIEKCEYEAIFRQSGPALIQYTVSCVFTMPSGG